MIKLNVGCGQVFLKGYTNIDSDTIEQILERYGGKDLEVFKRFPDTFEKVYNYDVFNLPYKDGEVDEILCEGFLEHLSFEEEGKFLFDAKRVLKVNGLFHFTVPDFDSLARQWLEAEDDFKEFYKVGTDEHWFGNWSRTLDNKWGYLTAFIFGNQNGTGQFHRNAYTVKKICKMMSSLDFSYQLSFFNFKNTKAKMIECKAFKR